jgi:hypothetical protein
VTEPQDLTPPGTTSRGSKGVAITNWLVSKASGVLERKTSRRGFLIGSAMAGSAVAVAGCVPVMKPGTAYTHVTDCGGGLCTDGYTEFCCTINDGLNACPPDSFWGGWWRADYSSFCNGTRYYIDCMQNCCGPLTGYQNFCAGCEECRCAGGCDSRRVYCNYFRYGQCHTEIVSTGPIACRVVLCVPPYAVDPACSTATLVDNSTAEHTSPCITQPLPATALPSVGSAVNPSPGVVTMFTRSGSTAIAYRTFDGSTWQGWVEIPPNINSGLAAVEVGGSEYVFARGTDGRIHYNVRIGGSWAGDTALSGLNATSDPRAVVFLGQLHVFARGSDHALWHGVITDGSWSGWSSLGGSWTSNAAVAASASGLFVFARGTDYSLSYNALAGPSWNGWSVIGLNAASDPAAVVDGPGVAVFVRQQGDTIATRSFTGSVWTAWQDLGGYAKSDPVAVQGPDALYLFARGGNGGGWCNRRLGGSWSGFFSLGGNIDTDIAAVGDLTGVFAFTRGTDAALWWGHFPFGQWTGWQPLGGALAPVTAIS